MEVVHRNYPDMSPPGGAFVHAVRANGLLFLSGFTAGNSPAEGGDMAAQTEATIDRIEEVLKAEGGGLDDVVKVTVYVTELDNIREIHEVRFRRWGDKLPASTLVEVSALVRPSLKIEIDAIAALPG